jgi:hypothetical protein
MLKRTFRLIIFVLLLKKKRDVSSHPSMLGEHLFSSLSVMTQSNALVATPCLF